MKPEKTIGQTIRRALRIDRALRLVWQAAPGWTMINAALIFVQGLLPLAALYLMKRIVDAVSAGLVSSDKAAAFHEVLIWLLLAGVVAMFAALSRPLAELAGEAQSQKVTDSISDVLHAQSIAVDLEYYEDPQYYDTLHLAQQQAPYRPARIVNGLVQIGQNGIALAGIIVLLFSINWLVALVLLAAAFPGAIVRLAYARKLYDFERNQAETERKAWYYHWVLTDPGHAKEIRLFNIGPFFKERFRAIRQELREGKLALSARRSIIDLVTQIFATAAIFGTFAFICREAVTGTVTLGGLVMYYLGFQSGLSFLQAILRGLAGLYEDNLFLTGLYEFLDLRPAIKPPAQPQPVPQATDRGINIRGVTFAYPGMSTEALKDIDLSLAPGQVIALVGRNGSGKTTLIKLLCRLYDPGRGRIEIEGTDIRQLDPVAWRREISVVLQDYIHYSLTARENICVGDIDRVPAQDEVVRAAVQSGADLLIRSLPQGYDTMLGRGFQEGLELSTGEWQKVAIARAFLRNARIVVLDEPSSSLDPLAEAELFSKFRKIMEGRSAILISHRFSTVKMADYIYVMDEGRIIEQGTHDDLMNQNGSYSLMYRTQAGQ
ncbi:MAG TPA: ABC transporter ATP-binding protein [Dissulfurispiraceae bacterium]|nr:ABC transporter ATP-binding protein [Dissulfurispiraceae bacterium]